MVEHYENPRNVGSFDNSLVLAVALSPFLGAGLPVLVAGAGGIVVGLALGARAREESA